MSQSALPASSAVSRRSDSPRRTTERGDRRQFANGHSDLSPEAAELAVAIDEYKLIHRRRFITYEEMLDVIVALGYSK